MPLLTGWIARENDYPVPISAELLAQIPTNAAAPVMGNQPQNAGYENVTDTVASLEVSANSPDGGDILYQWYVNSTNSNVGGDSIDGATWATYQPDLTGMTAGQAKYYYCVVTNFNDSMTGIQSVSITSDVACVHLHQVDTSNFTDYNATQHWAACTVDGCGRASGHANHSFDGNWCVCGALNANYYDGGAHDTSWYTNNPNASEYVLTNPAQLYGLADIVNAGTDTFADQTIKLGANMVFNIGDASTWKNADPDDMYTWTPIGDGTKVSSVIHDYFAGIFDGQGYILSGLYFNQGANGAFFQWTFDAEIKDFAIINTYFRHERTNGNGQGLATFVSRAYGSDLKNLYTNAILENCSQKSDNTKASTWFTGGIAGFVKGNATEASVSYGSASVENCVFAGTIIDELHGAGEGVGGIVGGDDGKAITIKNCLFSGSLSSNDSCVGGIIGRVTNAGTKVQNCVVAGEMRRNVVTIGSAIPATNKGGSPGTNLTTWGAVVGHASGSTIENCYYDPNATDIADGSVAFVLPLNGAYSSAVANGNVSLSRDQMKGDAALTNMAKLFEGQTPAWKVVANGYPIPTDVVIP